MNPSDSTERSATKLKRQRTAALQDAGAAEFGSVNPQGLGVRLSFAAFDKCACSKPTYMHSVALTCILLFIAGCRHEPAADIVIVNGIEPESLDPAIVTAV